GASLTRDRTAPGDATREPGPHAQRRRRFQPPARRRHTAPRPPGEPGASDAALLRIGLHPARAHLELDLPDRPWPDDGDRLDSFRTSLGGRPALAGRLFSALLLDASRLDHAAMGASRRIAGGCGIRPAALLDEHLLGRNRISGGGLPYPGRAAAAAGEPPHARRVIAWRGHGPAATFPPVRNRIAGAVRRTIFFAGFPPDLASAGNRRLGCIAGAGDHASAKPRGHGQLDYHAVPVEPIPIRSAHHVHDRTASPASSRSHAGTAPGFRCA